MNYYHLIKPFLFALSPERAHHFTLAMAQTMLRCGLLPKTTIPSLPVHYMGMDFPNPIGLAAGLDKNADYLDLWAHMGFGFVEVGTVTPKAQAGQPKPRLFRLSEHHALINRMGFNNKGVEYLQRRVEASAYQGILGINIGKNAVTPLEHALQDYRIGFEAVYPLATYITVNISSPNTKGLRDLQHGNALAALIAGLKTTQAHCQSRWQRYVPMWVKVAPDLSNDECESMAAVLLEHEVDAIVVANTTKQRPVSMQNHPHAHEAGGLSGEVLMPIAQQAMADWHAIVDGKVPLIGVGGISNGQAAKDRLNAGATLLQLYTALIYEGPALLKSIIQFLSEHAS